MFFSGSRNLREDVLHKTPPRKMSKTGASRPDVSRLEWLYCSGQTYTPFFSSKIRRGTDRCNRIMCRVLTALHAAGRSSKSVDQRDHCPLFCSPHFAEIVILFRPSYCRPPSPPPALFLEVLFLLSPSLLRPKLPTTTPAPAPSGSPSPNILRLPSRQHALLYTVYLHGIYDFFYDSIAHI